MISAARSHSLVGYRAISRQVLLPLVSQRNVSALSAIHRGLRLSEGTKPQGPKPLFSPRNDGYESDWRGLSRDERISLRRNAPKPLFKIRKGIKDITEKPGPGVPSRAARFHDPSSSFGKKSLVYQLQHGEFADQLEEAIKEQNKRKKFGSGELGPSRSQGTFDQRADASPDQDSYQAGEGDNSQRTNTRGYDVDRYNPEKSWELDKDSPERIKYPKRIKYQSDRGESFRLRRPQRRTFERPRGYGSDRSARSRITASSGSLFELPAFTENSRRATETDGYRINRDGRDRDQRQNSLRRPNEERAFIESDYDGKPETARYRADWGARDRDQRQTSFGRSYQDPDFIEDNRDGEIESDRYRFDRGALGRDQRQTSFGRPYEGRPYEEPGINRRQDSFERPYEGRPYEEPGINRRQNSFERPYEGRPYEERGINRDGADGETETGKYWVYRDGRDRDQRQTSFGRPYEDPNIDTDGGYPEVDRRRRDVGSYDGGRFYDRTRINGDGNADERTPRRDEGPISIPYTTAASQFLYGASTVEAALRQTKRTLYKLYIYEGKNRRNLAKDREMARLAQGCGIPVEFVAENKLGMLNKMADSRPHNGFVLEASPLPQLPVTALGEVSEAEDKPGFGIELGHQSAEELKVNGSPDFVTTEKSTHKPLVVVLDQILDPGNLGAILRSASFMGVTAVGVTSGSAAVGGPVALKASAGAAESITTFSIEDLPGFLGKSKDAGWSVYAAVSPGHLKRADRHDAYDLEKMDPLHDKPCILVFGSEGTGLSSALLKTLRKFAKEVSIPNFSKSVVVDSLNVSVAAALLCSAFLRGRNQARQLGIEDPGALF